MNNISIKDALQSAPGIVEVALSLVATFIYMSLLVFVC